MADARTARGRREEREGRASAYFHDVFRPRCTGLTTLAAAQALADEALPEDHPGRPYHARLREFLASLDVPAGAGLGERLLYMSLARLVTDSGELPPDEFMDLEDRFRRASPPAR